MNILFLIASVFFFIWIIRNVLFWVSLWQLKEYRLDRVRIHLFETMQGKNLLFSPLSLIKWITLFLFGTVIFNDRFFNAYYFLIAGLFIFQGTLVLKELVLHLLKRPKFTPKAILLCLLTLLPIIGFFAVPIIDRYVWLLVLDRIVAVVVFVLVILFSIPTEFYRDLKIEKAVKKLTQYKMSNKSLLIIGVTGSYGKSSTKEYISQILEKKFRLVKTKGTNNTPIGIANTILGSLKKTTQIFVVEMGAYKIGEIAQMCNMVHPTIGVLTAVNEQHLSLFGSIDNTMKAKYELIDSLPKDGLAIFNGNNANAQKLFVKTKKKKILYSVTYQKQDMPVDSSHIYATNVVIEKNAILFDALIRNKTMHLKAPLLGAHNIENILPGIYIASHLGMKEADIKKAVSLLTPIEKTMIYNEINGVSIIDDTFNANPEAVRAALQYMKIYKKKKIFVLQPMIELGTNAKHDHYEVAKEIAGVCDYLFVTNKNFYSEIVQGVRDAGKKCSLQVGNTAFIAGSLQKIIDKGDVVVCEGKEAAFVLDRLL